MLYTIIITHADGTQTTTHTNASNARRAHENAQQLITHTKRIGGVKANIERKESECITVRVYPVTQASNGDIITYNVLRGALQIAKKSAEKAISNGGTDTQYRICSELTSVNARVGAESAEKNGAGYVLDLIARLSADSQDIFSCAYGGILQAIADGAPIDEQYHAGYLSINAHIMVQRSASQTECSTEYIGADGGALVAINSYMARIIKNGECYIPIGSGEMDAATAARLGAAISASMATLTPRQKDIVKCVAVGLSQQQTAEKLHIKNGATIELHLQNIRKKVLEYFTENATEFLPLIDGEQVQATHEKRRKDRHTQASKHTAEYYREYRARKKAEKQAENKA